MDHREIVRAAMSFGETRSVTEVIEAQERRQKDHAKPKGSAKNSRLAVDNGVPPASSGAPKQSELDKLAALMGGRPAPPVGE